MGQSTKFGRTRPRFDQHRPIVGQTWSFWAISCRKLVNLGQMLAEPPNLVDPGQFRANVGQLCSHRPTHGSWYGVHFWTSPRCGPIFLGAQIGHSCLGRQRRPDSTTSGFIARRFGCLLRVSSPVCAGGPSPLRSRLLGARARRWPPTAVAVAGLPPALPSEQDCGVRALPPSPPPLSTASGQVPAPVMGCFVKG